MNEIEKEFQDFLKDNNINYKPNPNKYPIIDKWNYKYQYMPHREIIEKKLEELVDKQIHNLMQETMRRFLRIEEISAKTEVEE